MQPPRVDRPGTGEGLPQEVLGVGVERSGSDGGGAGAPPGHLVGPLLRQLGEHRQPGPHVLAALRVMGRQRRHGVGPRGELAAVPPVQLVDRGPQVGGVAADLVERGQPQPTVERGVLDALGHHRAAGLLEPHDELVAVPAPAEVAQRQRDDEVEGAVPVLREPLPGRVGSGGHDASRLRRRRLARHDVGPVDRDGDEQLDQRLPQAAPGVVAQLEVLLADRGGDLDQPGHLRLQPVLDHEPLGLLDDDVEVGRLAGEPGVEVGQRRRGRRVEQDSADPEQRVVARGARARPVAGQPLVALQDLLDDHPRPAGRLGQLPQVAARVGQPVRVVDPQPVDPALVDQREQHRVRLGEHLAGPRPAGRRACRCRRTAGSSAPRRRPASAPAGRTAGRAGPAAAGPRCRGGPGTRGRSSAAPARRSPRLAVEGDLAVRHASPMRRPSTGISMARSCAVPVDVEPAGVRRRGPVRSTDHSAALSDAGVGTAMWFGTTSTTIAQAELAGPRRRAGGTPPRRRGPRSTARGRRRRSRASSRAWPAGRGRGRRARPPGRAGRAAPRRRRANPNPGAQLEPVGGAGGPTEAARASSDHPAQHEDRSAHSTRHRLAGLGGGAVDDRAARRCRGRPPSARRTPRGGS